MAKKKEKLQVGAPTKYDDKYCDLIIEYFSVKPYEKKGDKVEASDIPTFAGFAAKMGIHRETLLNWTKEHEKFFDAFKKAKDLQENWIVVNGNKGLINPAFAIFTAKNVLNWRDKKEIDVTGTVEKLSDEELQKKIEEKKKKLLE